MPIQRVKTGEAPGTAAPGTAVREELPGVEVEEAPRMEVAPAAHRAAMMAAFPRHALGFAAVEIEGVVLGALMKIRVEGVGPAELLEAIRAVDPAAKFRTEFPSKSFGGGGGRDLKLARVLVMNIKVTDAGKFIDLTCHGDGEYFPIRVGKRSADGFAAAVAALGRVSERNLAAIEKAFAEKGSATVVLADAEQIGVKYSTMDDGTKFSAEFVADAPAVAA